MKNTIELLFFLILATFFLQNKILKFYINIPLRNLENCSILHRSHICHRKVLKRSFNSLLNKLFGCIFHRDFQSISLSEIPLWLHR